MEVYAPSTEMMSSSLDAMSSVISAAPGDCGQSLALDLASSAASSVGDAVAQLVRESTATLSRSKAPAVDFRSAETIAATGAKIAKHCEVLVFV